MNSVYIPEGYKPKLDAYQTQLAIDYIKKTFQKEFSQTPKKKVNIPSVKWVVTGEIDD